jgi:hypothetical protein
LFPICLYEGEVVETEPSPEGKEGPRRKRAELTGKTRKIKSNCSRRKTGLKCHESAAMGFNKKECPA